MIEHVRIGGLDVDIVDDDGVDGFGEWREHASEIRVKPGLTQQVLASTLLHEVIHALADTYGIAMAERTVRMLEHGLVGAVRADPEGARVWMSAVLDEDDVSVDGGEG